MNEKCYCRRLVFVAYYICAIHNIQIFDLNLFKSIKQAQKVSGKMCMAHKFVEKRQTFSRLGIIFYYHYEKAPKQMMKIKFRNETEKM